MPACRQSDITLAVLAGGRGTRMGQAKGDLDINGTPILRYLLQRLDWTGPTLLITAPGRERPPAWDDFDREVSDPIAGGGPLRGLLTALQHARTTLVVITTVDMPLVGKRQLQWLAAGLRSRRNLLGVMVRRTDADGAHVEPFPSAFRRIAAERVARRLDEAKASVRELIESPSFIALPAPGDWDDSTWLNLNFPDDVTSFIRQIGQDSGNPQFAAEVATEDHRAV